MIVWISGPTGAGKSSLSRLIASLGYSVVQERVPTERFRQFTSDPVRHCAQLQEEVMQSRFDAWQRVSDSSCIFFDRSIDEDVRVFCRMHRELKFLNESEFEHLEKVALGLQHRMPGPDLIVFVCPSVQALEQRVTQLSHPSFIVSNLKRQVSLYADWLETRSEDILRLDNSPCSLETLQRLFEEDPRC